MKYRSIYLKRVMLFVLSIISIKAFSQLVPPSSSSSYAMPTVVPPSPTVANLMNFEEVPVDNYTGQPDITIPLFTKQLNSELTFPLVLRYSTMGVRIEQRSGWVGTGWSLDGGGVISRTIRGFADEQVQSGSYDDVVGIFHNLDFWNLPNLNSNDQQKFTWYINGDSDKKYDAQPDLYQFSILGLSGRFVIVKEGSQFVAKQLDMDQKLKIEFTMDNNKTITGFTITDTNGYKYIFGGNDAIETTLSESKVFTRRRDSSPVDISFPTTMPEANSAWMLSSIKTSNNQELASFEYTSSEEEFDAPVSRTLTDFAIDANWYTQQLQSSYNISQFRPISTSIYTKITTQTKKLLRVNFIDQTSIDFIHTSTHPENSGLYLDKIKINKKVGTVDQIVREFDLQYEIVNSRLWLMKILGGNRFDYKLEYFQKNQLPGVNSENIDQWGYNRSDFRNDNTYGYNFYDFNAIKRGLLTKIIYPAGGAKEFFWEQNTFSYEGSQLIENFDSNPYNSTITDFTHEFKSSVQGTNLPGETLTIDHEHDINVQVNTTYNGDDLYKFQVLFKKGDMEQVISLDDLPGNVHLLPGTYTVSVKRKWQYDANVGTSTYLQGYINIMYLVNATESNYSNYLLGGGPRIQSIRFTDPNHNFPLEEKAYSYNIVVPIGTGFRQKTYSSGSVDAIIGSMRKEYTIEDKKYLFHNYDELTIAPFTIKYKVTTNEPNIQLTRGNYIGYKRVAVKDEVTFIGTYPNGYTEYIYTNGIDAPSDPLVFVYPYIERPNKDYLRGLLKRKTIYNKGLEKLEETINEYTAVTTEITKSYTIAPTACKWAQFYNSYNSYMGGYPTYPVQCGQFDCFNGEYGNCGSVPFSLYTTHIEAAKSNLTSTIVKKYFPPEEHPIQSTTTYTYNTANYQLKQQTSTYNEGNDITQEITEYEYPVGGYTASLFQDAGDITAINNIVALNIINKPIAVTTYKYYGLLQRVVNKYKTFLPNQVLLGQVETLKGGQTAAVPEDRIIYSRYNEIGNLTEVYTASTPAIRTCYIWGYNGTLPVAEIKNIADYSLLPQNVIATIQSTSLSGVEANLLPSLETLRLHSSVAGSQVTTLTHDTIDGVLSVKDPKNYKLTYTYDVLGRLLEIKDNDGMIINEYKYNFR